MIDRHKTNDLSESQPTKGNIAGGLTTIEEKALGNSQKIGKRAKFIDVLEPAEAPGKGAGLCGSWTPPRRRRNACTLQAAAGFVVHFFPTGQGNVIGNPIDAGDQALRQSHYRSTMSEHIDLDVSGILKGETTIDQAGDQCLELMRRVANGRWTGSETLGHREFVLTKLYRSA